MLPEACELGGITVKTNLCLPGTGLVSVQVAVCPAMSQRARGGCAVPTICQPAGTVAVSVPEPEYRPVRMETDATRLTGTGACVRVGRTVALTVDFGTGARVTRAGGCSGALCAGPETAGGTEVGELADLRPVGGLVTETDADGEAEAEVETRADERAAACVLRATLAVLELGVDTTVARATVVAAVSRVPGSFAINHPANTAAAPAPAISAR